MAVRISALFVCVTKSRAAAAYGTKPVADRIQRQFTRDNDSVARGTVAAPKPDAELEIGDVENSARIRQTIRTGSKAWRREQSWVDTNRNRRLLPVNPLLGTRYSDGKPLERYVESDRYSESPFEEVA